MNMMTEMQYISVYMMERHDTMHGTSHTRWQLLNLMLFMILQRKEKNSWEYYVALDSHHMIMLTGATQKKNLILIMRYTLSYRHSYWTKKLSDESMSSNYKIQKLYRVVLDFIIYVYEINNTKDAF